MMILENLEKRLKKAVEEQREKLEIEKERKEKDLWKPKTGLGKAILFLTIPLGIKCVYDGLIVFHLWIIRGINLGMEMCSSLVKDNTLTKIVLERIGQENEIVQGMMKEKLIELLFIPLAMIGVYMLAKWVDQKVAERRETSESNS